MGSCSAAGPARRAGRVLARARGAMALSATGACHPALLLLMALHIQPQGSSAPTPPTPRALSFTIPGGSDMQRPIPSVRCSPVPASPRRDPPLSEQATRITFPAQQQQRGDSTYLCDLQLRSQPVRDGGKDACKCDMQLGPQPGGARDGGADERCGAGGVKRVSLAECGPSGADKACEGRGEALQKLGDLAKGSMDVQSSQQRSRMDDMKRTAITDFFRREHPIRSLTGTFCDDPARPVCTPSPHRTTAAFALRNEMSWIGSTLPKGLKPEWTLVHRFVRPMPSSAERYHARLVEELDLIYRFNFQESFVHVLGILEHARGMPYLVRGSAAGSLVCYLLGISHIDPVREDMALARFMHALRSDLPDIDLDFPHTQRDEVFFRLFQRAPASAARISNHVYFRARSAKREAARRMLVHRHVPRDKSPSHFFEGEAKETYRRISAQLEGTLSGYSLHCGGVIVLRDKPIREADRVVHPIGFGGKFGDHQVVWDKRDCQRKGLIKIDVLSNRGLSHLWEISKKHVYEYPGEDAATAALLSAADTVGISFCESPAMKKALRMLRPACRRDLALALAIIRPAATGARRRTDFLSEYAKRRDYIVFDDDAVRALELMLNCSQAQAEVYRKGFAKRDKGLMAEVREGLRTQGLEESEIASAMGVLQDAHKYGFCKAHAMSYAHMVWALAYEKAHNRAGFWRAHASNVLKEGTNVYERWVYRREAELAGVTQAFGKQTPLKGHALGAHGELREYGSWGGPAFLPGCYFRQRTPAREGQGAVWEFRGLFAAGRVYRRKVGFLTLGVGNKVYLDVCYSPQVGVGIAEKGGWGGLIEGKGVMRGAFGSAWIQACVLQRAPLSDEGGGGGGGDTADAMMRDDEGGGG